MYMYVVATHMACSRLCCIWLTIRLGPCTTVKDFSNTFRSQVVINLVHKGYLI